MSKVPLKVSLNKIAEFAYASSARKEAIVRDQKNKKAFIAGGYKEAEHFVPNFFLKNQDPNLLEDQLKSLVGLNGLTPKDSLRNSINGLNALREMTPINFGEGINYHYYQRNKTDGIMVGNVFINVRPDILLTRNSRRSTELGAAKLHFPKSSNVGEKEGECVAAILYEFLTQSDLQIGTPKYNLCHSVDVFSGGIYKSPRSYIRLMREVGAACKQYELIWNQL